MRSRRRSPAALQRTLQESNAWLDEVACRSRPWASMRNATRIGLGLLMAVVAVNAFAGGIYGLTGARDIPRAWLQGSPFADYLIPSLILLIVVGGSLLLAAIAVLARWPVARGLSFAAGTILLGWVIVQVLIIGPVSWLQAIMALVSGAIWLLASRLPRRASSPA
jgi:hypothetical protein